VTDSREVTFQVRPCSHCGDRVKCAQFGTDYDPAICERCVRKVARAFEHVSAAPAEVRP